MIKTASCSLSELFNGQITSTQEDGTIVTISGQLNVPEYQRPYLWGEKEVDKILDDLNEHFSKDSVKKNDFYLGSIILHQKGNTLNIIDGQQRLTTIALLLAALNISEIPTINYSSPSSTSQIRHNYRYLLTQARYYQRVAFYLRDNINITLVVTDREDDAYTFFETQNTGGVRLSGVDIIKAYHLRAISQKLTRSRAAVKWEKQLALDTVVSLLLKARYWNVLKMKPAPLRKNKRGLKIAIVQEFSERTRKGDLPDVGFVVAKVRTTSSGVETTIPGLPFAIRQPLNDGKNLIDYMASFCTLYHDILPYAEGAWDDKSYDSFINKLVKPTDGTLYLKELFEVAMLSYAHRFGTVNIYEAALWIFRCTYEPRLKNAKTVKEASVPDFIKGYPVIDIILNSFDHKELIGTLKRFKVTVSKENLTGNTVKFRYLQRLTGFFDMNFHIEAEAIDKCFKEAINKVLN